MLIMLISHIRNSGSAIPAATAAAAVGNDAAAHVPRAAAAAAGGTGRRPSDGGGGEQQRRTRWRQGALCGLQLWPAEEPLSVLRHLPVHLPVPDRLSVLPVHAQQEVQPLRHRVLGGRERSSRLTRSVGAGPGSVRCNSVRTIAIVLE